MWLLWPLKSVFLTAILFALLTEVMGDGGACERKVWLRACLHGGGAPQVGEVTCLGGITRLSI